MKNKFFFCAFIIVFIALFATSKAEARSHFSINIGGLFGPPAPTYVIEPAPVYVAPCPPPAPVIYVAPRHYVEPVYVRPAPVYVRPAPVYTGFSFGWH